MVIYDGGELCTGYSCCKLEPGTLKYCHIAEKYVGKGSKACENHLISWAGLEKKRAEKKKKVA